METDGRRQSDNFEDRGRGSGGRAQGGLPIQALLGVARMLGLKGTLVVAAILGVGYFFLPSGLKSQLFSAVGGASPGGVGEGSVCKASAVNAKACDFSRVVLASTEDVWTAKFRAGELPSYGRASGTYAEPVLVVFSDSVASGCGNASAAMGPFYCPLDRKLYIDPSFYDVMEQRLRAPGDFAQAYVIAHEVAHHVQNLIGATEVQPRGDSKNETSVRVELQADCLAGVWGHTAQSSLAINDEDLREALNAAHAIGDDTLGQTNASEHTHGTSEQRMRWFRRGFASGNPRECETFQAARSRQL